ncbi:MAG: hypothetical protein EOP60_16605, partial [Sphingomonadales bacterium]
MPFDNRPFSICRPHPEPIAAVSVPLETGGNMQDHETARPRARSLYATIVGSILAIAGLVLTIGGAWLTILGGSPFYLIAGIGLLASGILLIRGRLLGAWIYGATW